MWMYVCVKSIWLYGCRLSKMQMLRKNPQKKVKLWVAKMTVNQCHHQKNCLTGVLKWLVAFRALNWPTGQHHGAMVSHFVPSSIISGQTWCKFLSLRCWNTAYSILETVIFKLPELTHYALWMPRPFFQGIRAELIRWSRHLWYRYE